MKSFGSLGTLDRGELQDGLLNGLLAGGRCCDALGELGADTDGVGSAMGSIERCMGEIRTLFMALDAGDGLAELGMTGEELSFVIETLLGEIASLRVRIQGMAMGRGRGVVG